MTEQGYLAIAIFILVALGILAVVLFLLLRNGTKVERAHCEGCDETMCPIARSREAKK